MIVKLRIERELDRRAIIYCLAANRYRVWIEESNTFPETTYYVCFRYEEEEK